MTEHPTAIFWTLRLPEQPYALRGLSININGLNKSTHDHFSRLFSGLQIIAFQETKFLTLTT